MAGKYTTRKEHQGGITIDEWVKKVAMKSVTDHQWRGKETMIDAWDMKTSKFVLTPWYKCGVCFERLAPQFDGSKKRDSKESTPTILGQLSSLHPVVWNPLNTDWSTITIPFGCPKFYNYVRKEGEKESTTESSIQAITTIESYAVMWITANKMGVEMNPRHVCSMLLSALHSMLNLMLTADQDSSRKLAFLIRNLTGTAVNYFQNPQVAAPLEALMEDTEASDMTQRSIALFLSPRFISNRERHEILLSILEISLLRWHKHINPKVDNFLTKIPKGIFNILVFYPALIAMGLYREGEGLPPSVALKEGEKSDVDLVALHMSSVKLSDPYDVAILKMVEMTKDIDIKDSPSTIAGHVISRICKMYGLDLTINACSKFYDWSLVQNKKNIGVPDYQTLGLIPIEDIKCPLIDRTGFTVKNVNLPEIRLYKLTETSVKLKSPLPTSWAAFSIKENGFYKITATCTAGAEPASGNSQGKNMVANLRFTVGLDVLPPSMAGFSSAGMVQTGRNHRDTGKILNITSGFFVVIDTVKDRSLCVYTDSDYKQLFGKLDFSALSNLSSVIGFKYCSLVVEKVDPPKPPIPGPFATLAFTTTTSKTNDRGDNVKTKTNTKESTPLKKDAEPVHGTFVEGIYALMMKQSESSKSSNSKNDKDKTLDPPQTPSQPPANPTAVASPTVVAIPTVVASPTVVESPTVPLNKRPEAETQLSPEDILATFVYGGVESTNLSDSLVDDALVHTKKKQNDGSSMSTSSSSASTSSSSNT
jgi:hypothetical protein